MAFNSEGAVGGAASGAAAGSAAGPWGALIGGVAGGALGGFMGGKKKKPIDISQQLAQLQSTYAKNQQNNAALTQGLNPMTAQYKTDLQNLLAGQRTDFTGNKNEYLAATDANTKEAQDVLRKSLYSDTFKGVPDSLQAIREASAAGGGLKTGSYQKAVGDFGSELASTLGQGERDIQVAGLQNRQGAQENTYNAFNALSSKLSDQQMEGLTKVMDTGRADLIREYTTSMGLSEAETQGVIDLLNFQQSGEFAGDTADNASKNALLSSLFQAGGTLAGNYSKKPVAPQPKKVA